MKLYFLLFAGILFLLSCSRKEQKVDAYGNFETTETTISAQESGPLLAFNVHEGDSLIAGDTVGYIDTLQLYLKKEQLDAQIASLRTQLPDASVQLQVISQELSHAKEEQTRTENLLADNAATPQQRDDMNAQVALLQKKYASLQSSLSIQSRSILSQIKPMEIQIKQINDQIARSIIVNPLKGVVLLKLAEPNEMVTYGKPLYQIGNLSQMILRAYLTGDQLSQVKIGQTVTILTDEPDNKDRQWKGKITWISDESEFTPKQIQTKDERSNLVYGIKISVKNDGTIKIGMPGEVVFR
jgi:HlyD family secretion protein